jgi:hypothetical protein
MLLFAELVVLLVADPLIEPEAEALGDDVEPSEPEAEALGDDVEPREPEAEALGEDEEPREPEADALGELELLSEPEADALGAVELLGDVELYEEPPDVAEDFVIAVTEEHAERSAEAAPPAEALALGADVEEEASRQDSWTLSPLLRSRRLAAALASTESVRDVDIASDLTVIVFES